MVLVDVDVTTGNFNGQGTITQTINPATSQTYYNVDIIGTQTNIYWSNQVGRYPYPYATPTGYQTANEEQQPYFIFDGITIPQNSTIIDATLTFHMQTNGGLLTNTGKVYARKTASPVTPTVTGFFTKPRATAFGTFTISGTPTSTTFTQKQVDVQATVQELVNSFDYSNDNMMFIMRMPLPVPSPTGDTYFEAQVKAYGGGGATVPNLTVNYTDPAGIKTFAIDAVIIFKKQEFTIDARLVPIAQISINAILDGGSVIIRPIEDTLNEDGSWTDIKYGNNDGALWDELDEITADDNTTAISGKEGKDFEIKLQPINDPNSPLAHTIRIRMRSTIGTSTVISLIQGTTTIATNGFTPTVGPYVDFEFTLTEVQADSITDYSDLRIRISDT